MSALKEDIPTLDAAGYRKFGLTTGAIFVVVFGLFFPWLRDRTMDTWPTWPFVVGGAFAVPGLLLPMALKPVYFVWMRIGGVLGFINTRIILGIFYAVLMVPIALFFKVVGRDPMRRGYDKAAASYRVKVEPRDPKSMEVPF